MRKLLSVVAAAFLLSVAFAGGASAQETHFGMIDADPAAVPEAGEYTLVANGTGWLPDTSILLTSCTAPGERLVPGEAELEDILEAAGRIDPFQHCDLVTAAAIDVDSDGNFTAEMVAEVGDNFFFTAGALDGSQAGAAWIPIGVPEPAADEALADTGVETGLLAVIGAGVLGAGVMIAREARRHD